MLSIQIDTKNLQFLVLQHQIVLLLKPYEIEFFSKVHSKCKENFCQIELKLDLATHAFKQRLHSTNKNTFLWWSLLSLLCSSTLLVYPLLLTYFQRISCPWCRFRSISSLLVLSFSQALKAILERKKGKVRGTADWEVIICLPKRVSSTTRDLKCRRPPSPFCHRKH